MGPCGKRGQRPNLLREFLDGVALVCTAGHLTAQQKRGFFGANARTNSKLLSCDFPKQLGPQHSSTLRGRLFVGTMDSR